MKVSVPGELQFYHKEENESSSEHHKFNQWSTFRIPHIGFVIRIQSELITPI